MLVGVLDVAFQIEPSCRQVWCIVADRCGCLPARYQFFLTLGEFNVRTPVMSARDGQLGLLCLLPNLCSSARC
ncbi:hypothetical protein M758_8G118000 [Ceratodon purpureus]|nr:hypothetical protein M758_8G118000 [Ceratodon purpureus]